MSLPTLSGTGRLIDDPELRFTPSGKAVAKVRIAFNSRKKNDQGEWVDDKVFFANGTIWGQEAENVAESLQRGIEVVVTGRLETRSYENKDGEKRSVMELLVDSIGPTLRYATAQVRKMDRSKGGGQQAAGGFEDPWASAAPASADTSRSGGFSDEPPF